MKNIYAFFSLILSSVLFTTNVQAINGSFGGGDGESTPYLIEDAADLNAVRNGLAKNYQLAANIDLTDWLTANGGTTGWNPIGTSTTSFTGNFDGNGKFITGLWINNSSANDQGLFGYVRGNATIQKLGIIISGNLIGKENVGAIVAQVPYGSASETVTIDQCYVKGTVKGVKNVGGIVGYVSIVGALNITNCYTEGSIMGTDATNSDGIGGILGMAYRNVHIQNCYSIASVDNGGTKSAGGLVGGISLQASNFTAIIEKSYSINTAILSGGTSVGRILGYKGSTGTVSLIDNYAYSGVLVKSAIVSGSSTDNNGLSKSSSQLKQIATYTGWDFTNVWQMGNSNYSLPVLKTLSTTNQPSALPTELADAFATINITTAEQLYNVRNNLSADYRLDANIDLSVDYSNGWTPIGATSGSTNQFTGSFDGNGHVISGLYINEISTTADAAYGLFGIVKSAIICNLGVIGSVTAPYRAAGIVGQVETGATIENCFFEGTATATNTTNSFAGGIVAYNNWGTVSILNSYVGGEITASLAAGGIIGRSNGTHSTTIDKCYVTADIIGTVAAGGISGDTYKTSSGNKLYIKNSVVAGKKIVGTSGKTNRINGDKTANTNADIYTENQSFAGIQVNGESVSGSATDANGVDAALSQIVNQPLYQTTLNWDFDNIWTWNNTYKLPILKNLAGQPTEQLEHLTFTVPADGSKTAAEYSAVGGNIIIHSGGQITGSDNTGFEVSGVVKYRKTFTPAVWYAIGFPFELQSVYVKDFENDAEGPYLTADKDNIVGDYWLRDYNANAFQPADSIYADKGYIIQFPTTFENHEVAFLFANGATLKNYVEADLDAALNLASSGYYLVANPSAADLELNTANKYYIYNGTNNFDLQATATVKPFESFVVAKGIAPGALKSSLNIDELTALPELDLNEKVVATEYYNLQGVRVGANNYSGIFFVKTVYQSGAVSVGKIIWK